MNEEKRREVNRRKERISKRYTKKE